VRLGHETKLAASQRLVMTPALRQAVEILQLGAVELATYLQEQALGNPLLDLGEDLLTREELGQVEEAPAAPDADQVDEWLDYFADSSDLGLAERPPAADRPAPIEAVATGGGSLADHLRLQLALQDLSVELHAAAETLIAALDEDGYLRIPLEELAAAAASPPKIMAQALSLVQQMEPAGVAARDLAECLLLQLEALARTAPGGQGARAAETTLATVLVREHLDDLAAGRLGKLAQAIGATADQIAGALELIRGLDPRPGLAFAGEGSIRYIVPDAMIERVGNEYLVLINDAALPQLRINSYYRSLGSAGAEGPGVSAYVAERLRAALWVLRCVEQRRATLHRVVTAMARRQQRFLERGVRHLAPMTLKDVAAEVGVHESTVSRAVANKYVQTPQGAYELKFFFTSALDAAEGQGQVSSASVKQVLRELIDAEDARAPHSDQRLVELLHRRGAQLSRRTVTKYRRELGVPSSAQRRRP